MNEYMCVYVYMKLEYMYMYDLSCDQSLFVSYKTHTYALNFTPTDKTRKMLHTVYVYVFIYMHMYICTYIYTCI